MNRGMEQALESLIPLYSAPLPRELVDLARSLLAQSRTKAGNLKQEEEIARTYVCANIACERLKRTLNLPKIQPKPPIPPRSYKKLYEYFDKTLAIRRREAVSTPAKSQPVSAQNTPLPKSNLNTPSKAISTNTPIRLPPRSSTRKRGLLIDNTEKTIPEWIRPLINTLCISLEAPAAAAHILAGVTTILTVPSPSSLDSHKSGNGETTTTGDKKDKIAALISAVFILVATKLNGDKTNSGDFIAWRREVTKALKKAKSEMMEREIKWDWERWEDVLAKDINEWTEEITNKKWMDLDWFLNIEQGAGVDGEGVGGSLDLEEREIGGEDKRDMESDYLRAGLGTMYYDGVDFLSERRKREYRVWEESVLTRIEEIEAEDRDVDMER